MSEAGGLGAERRAAARRALRDQVAVVTGAAGAIGRAVAGTFVHAGARVVLGDRRGEALDALAAELGECAAAIECDVTQPEQVARLVGAARERWQRLDVLVNVAGVTHLDDVLDVSLDTWREVFAVNVEAVLTASQQAAAIMASQAVRPETGRRGTIVSIGSQGAEFPIPSSPAYGASKAALNYLSRTLAERPGAAGDLLDDRRSRHGLRGHVEGDRVPSGRSAGAVPGGSGRRTPCRDADRQVPEACGPG